jgi:hypothetical protein
LKEQFSIISWYFGGDDDHHHRGYAVTCVLIAPPASEDYDREPVLVLS